MAPILPFIPLIAAGVGAATTIAAIATRPSAPAAPAAPDKTATQVEQAKYTDAAAQAQAQALLKRRGMAATILTSPMGIAPTPSGQKSTLGG